MSKIGAIGGQLLPAIELSKADQGNDCDTQGDFHTVHIATAKAPLIEIVPAGYGDGAAALGFALAWMKAARIKKDAQGGLTFWAAPDHSFSEFGGPHASGLAQFGIDPSTLILVRTRNQLDALWAAEQALTLPCAQVLCTIAQSPKSLSLAASRRLLLSAEKSGARCVLLRFDPLSPSAARSRWRISAAPSHADDHGFGARELGPPAFNIQLERNRASPAGQIWRVDWNAHEHVFRERLPIDQLQPSDDANGHTDAKPMAGAVFAAPFYRPPALHRARAR